MKNRFLTISLVVLFVAAGIDKGMAQVTPLATAVPGLKYPWKEAELMEPANLAAAIKSGTAKITILNIGAVEDLPGAIHIGAVNGPENMMKLKKTLEALSKEKPIVIYCGCCPFTKCPNIQPAYLELKKSGFTQIRVLNLPTNLHTNWIAKGYPLAKN